MYLLTLLTYLHTESVEPQFGYTPLHCAAKRCSMPLIKMLVHHGAIVETKAARGETPLMVASEVRRTGLCLST